MSITVLELINLLEQMPDEAVVVTPIARGPGYGGHADVLTALYDRDLDAVVMLIE